MPQELSYPGLDRLHQALQRGEIETAREILHELDAREQALLRAELGDGGFERLFANARRGRRSEPRGRVILLNGIMGARLSSVSPGGIAEELWLNLFRLAQGRIGELELGLDGLAKRTGWNARVEGHMNSTYLAMLMRLNQDWDARPFAFDWRVDIDRSAERLAEDIKTWAKGEPVHLVAHSMGGLVSRRFIQMSPKVWDSMRDPDGLRRGGRLVMLGTPNYGSFAIPLALTGEEKMVKMLAAIDFSHNRTELLEILNSFCGSYQMLPSPAIDLQDDHARLFELGAWRKTPVREDLLARAKKFHEELHDVIEPDRMVYVAGYDQQTPHKIKIRGDGSFEYMQTRNGDGRVPHSLGLLKGVTTYWIKESHGDLPNNDSVLDAISDLMTTGTTDRLASVKPEKRSGVDADIPAKKAENLESEQPPAEFRVLADAFLSGERSAKTARSVESAEKRDLDAAKLATIIASDWCGGSRGSGERKTQAATPGARIEPGFPIDVRWADLAECDSDVCATGHYTGILPQRAELALDNLVSGYKTTPEREGVLHQLSRRGVLLGRLGEIALYPTAKRPGQLAAVVGMGHPGTFGRTEVRRVVRDLVSTIAALPGKRTLSMVLIGSGAGNVAMQAALENTIEGIRDALASAGRDDLLKGVELVEYDHAKAVEMHECVTELLAKSDGKAASRFIVGTGGNISSEEGMALALSAAVRSSASTRTEVAQALAAVLQSGLRDADHRAHALDSLRRAAKTCGDELGAGAENRISVRKRATENATDGGPTTRITFVHDTKCYRAAAIDDSSVVAERELSVDPKLVDELVQKMTDPAESAVADLTAMLHRLLIHRDLREVLRESRPIVFELDRRTAKVHWEMLARQVQDTDVRPLGLEVQIARQLRTTYSAPPSFDRRATRQLRALVVGDPGDPEERYDLPGARREALRVAQLLRDRGVDVVEMIGAPGPHRSAQLSNIRPASRIDVLNELMKGDYDILHYAGHGDFDPEHPDRVGWIFKGGLLTAAELERVDRVPSLVVANACLSGQVSEALARGKKVDEVRTEADILPTLADEFFHRGVRNYVGTAWEVNDYGAILFAETLYKNLLGDSKTQVAPMALGGALLEARRELAKQSSSFGALWAAYQHYGDPAFKFPRSNEPEPGTAQARSEQAKPASATPTRKKGSAKTPVTTATSSSTASRAVVRRRAVLADSGRPRATRADEPGRGARKPRKV